MTKEAGGENYKKGEENKRQLARKRCLETDKKGKKISGYTE